MLLRPAQIAALILLLLPAVVRSQEAPAESAPRLMDQPRADFSRAGRSS